MDASAPEATAAASVGCARAGVDEGTGLREPNARVTDTATGMGVPVARQASGEAAAGKSRSLGGGGTGGKVSGRKTALPMSTTTEAMPGTPPLSLTMVRPALLCPDARGRNTAVRKQDWPSADVRASVRRR